MPSISRSAVMQVQKVVVLVALLVIPSAVFYLEVCEYRGTEGTTQHRGTGNLTRHDSNTNIEKSYIFTCENINSIKLVRYLGKGVFKRAYLGRYGTGTNVTIKILTRGPFRYGGFDKQKMFMSEILLLQQLKHPNIIKLLGFCMRSNRHGTESLTDEGLVAVVEYGEGVDQDFLGHLPLSQRLDVALDIIDLLMYLENSPLGSLRLRDIQLRHFLFHENTLKLIDVDGNSEEPGCGDDATEYSKRRNETVTGETRGNNTCQFGRCVGHRCVGYNAKVNLLTVIDVLFLHLVTDVDIAKLKPETSRLEAPQHRAARALEKLIGLLHNKATVTSARVRQLLLDSRSVV